MDRDDKYLYSMGGSVIAYFDSKRQYMYTQDGVVYGYMSGTDKQYLYSMGSEIIGYFQPPFSDMK